MTDGKLLEDGVETTWITKLGDAEISVTTQIRVAGEFEFRKHTVHAEKSALAGWHLIEGSHALPLALEEKAKQESGDNWLALSNKSGAMLMSWRIGGYESSDSASSFDPGKNTNVNFIHPKCAVIGNMGGFEKTPLEFMSLHYASPEAPANDAVQKQASELLTK